jgi:hypothetical protein
VRAAGGLELPLEPKTPMPILAKLLLFSLSEFLPDEASPRSRAALCYPIFILCFTLEEPILTTYYRVIVLFLSFFPWEAFLRPLSVVTCLVTSQASEGAS